MRTGGGHGGGVDADRTRSSEARKESRFGGGGGVNKKLEKCKGREARAEGSRMGGNWEETKKGRSRL